MLARFRLFLNDQIGAAAAEMALILPLVMVMLFATFEGAYYIICEHQVVTGVRNAARYAGRLDFSQYQCPAATFSGDAQAVRNLARIGQLDTDVNVRPRVPGWPDDKTYVSVSCATSQDGIYSATSGNAPKVKVWARFNYPSLLGQLGFTQATIEIGAAAESPVMGL